ncbi:unnamed protein product [Rotaria sp. Silwood2]|nr:unnamed protein product [Rotaria sp. Silwood2]
MGFTTDLRKCRQLHQQNKYIARKKTNQNFLLSHLHLDTTNKTRSARSWIRDQLIDFKNDNFEENTNCYDDIYLEYSLEQIDIETYIQAQWNEIFEAIDNDNVDLLDCLIPPVNIYNYKEKYWSNEQYNQYCEDSNILLYAIRDGRINCIRVLLDKVYSGDVNPDILQGNCRFGQTPLSWACERGYMTLVRELVERAHVNIDQGALLGIAVRKGHQTLVEYLLTQGYNYQNKYDQFILCDASARGHSEIVKILLKYGADPNTLDYSGWTPLDYAIDQRNFDIAEILISYSHGNIKENGDHFTPLMIAAHYDLRSIVELLFKLLPIDRAADDLLRLACRYTIDLNMLNHDMALYFFVQGLNGKQISNNSNINEVYEFRQECQTLDQLESIQDDENAMRMHALLINERIFLQRQDHSSYIDLIEKQCNYYCDQHLYYRSLQLRLHAYQLMIRVQNDCPEARKLYENSLNRLVDNLQSILIQDDLVPIDSLVIIFNLIFEQYVPAMKFSQTNLLIIIGFVNDSIETGGKQG